MFKRTIWFLVILCGYEGSSIISSGSVYSKVGAFDRQIEKETKDMNRPKRGIVLVDEDFDVPPRSGNGVKEYDGIFDEEGLGNSLGSSGDGASEEWYKDTTKSLISSTHTHLESEHPDVSNKTTTPPSEEKVTEHIMKKSSSKKSYTSEIPDTIHVSSGDGMSQINEQSTTEMTTKITLNPENNTYENLPDACLNSSTCGIFDLDIFPSEYSLVPEGTNLTLTCRSNFSSQHTPVLYWYYKSNGSAYILQTFGTDQTLHLSLPDTKTFHTGMYKCVEWVETEFCCSKEVHVTVYEVPLYKYHLIILVLIAALGLFICIFLAVRQSKSLKMYKKEFVKRHGSAKHFLL